jgi:hypothetical protein
LNKITSGLAVLALGFSMTACGSGKPDGTEAGSTSNTPPSKSSSAKPPSDEIATVDDPAAACGDVVVDDEGGWATASGHRGEVKGSDGIVEQDAFAAVVEGQSRVVNLRIVTESGGLSKNTQALEVAQIDPESGETVGKTATLPWQAEADEFGDSLMMRQRCWGRYIAFELPKPDSDLVEVSTVAVLDLETGKHWTKPLIANATYVVSNDVVIGGFEEEGTFPIYRMYDAKTGKVRGNWSFNASGYEKVGVWDDDQGSAYAGADVDPFNVDSRPYQSLTFVGDKVTREDWDAASSIVDFFDTVRGQKLSVSYGEARLLDIPSGKVTTLSWWPQDEADDFAVCSLFDGEVWLTANGKNSVYDVKTGKENPEEADWTRCPVSVDGEKWVVLRGKDSNLAVLAKDFDISMTKAEDGD